MSRTRSSLLVVAVVAAMVVGLQPAAGAAVLGGGKLCVRHPVLPIEGRSARVRDLVTAPRHDPLTRWIRHHPSAADRAARAITVPLWFHVIRKDLTVAGGNVPDSRILAQIQVLNDAYGGTTGGANTGLRFSLQGITRTTNGSWFNSLEAARTRR